ncbi:hypothetical protein LCGC14_1803160 [marine sediment metagenome]|uniref:Uncharacterized protein n=1 Tax=marine sediment metagenome TaxID=412755 RepID=A0A0F9GNU7_9ZZZZ
MEPLHTSSLENAVVVKPAVYPNDIVKFMNHTTKTFRIRNPLYKPQNSNASKDCQETVDSVEALILTSSSDLNSDNTILDLTLSDSVTQKNQYIHIGNFSKEENAQLYHLIEKYNGNIEEIANNATLSIDKGRNCKAISKRVHAILFKRQWVSNNYEKEEVFANGPPRKKRRTIVETRHLNNENLVKELTEKTQKVVQVLGDQNNARFEKIYNLLNQNNRQLHESSLAEIESVKLKSKNLELELESNHLIAQCKIRNEHIALLKAQLAGAKNDSQKYKQWFLKLKQRLEKNPSVVIQRKDKQKWADLSGDNEPQIQKTDLTLSQGPLNHDLSSIQLTLDKAKNIMEAEKNKYCVSFK